MDREVDQALEKMAEERKSIEKELAALSNELKAAYAREATGGTDPTQRMEEAEEEPANSTGSMDFGSLGVGEAGGGAGIERAAR